MKDDNDFEKYVAICYWIFAVLFFLYAHFILKLSNV